MWPSLPPGRRHSLACCLLTRVLPAVAINISLDIRVARVDRFILSDSCRKAVPHLREKARKYFEIRSLPGTKYVGAGS